MKFEKLSENKIRITLSIHDLEEKDIDFHDFMSNSLETQDLFLDMLEEAEEKIGFRAQNCKIKIEALAMTEDNFVLTITKVLPASIGKKSIQNVSKVKPKIKRKTTSLISNHLIYKFNTFDDYCNFIDYLLGNKFADSFKMAEKITVYTYNNCYFLDLYNLNENYKKALLFSTIVTEFGSYVLNADLFASKLNEVGTVFIKNNALKKSFLKLEKK